MICAEAQQIVCRFKMLYNSEGLEAVFFNVDWQRKSRKYVLNGTNTNFSAELTHIWICVCDFGYTNSTSMCGLWRGKAYATIFILEILTFSVHPSK